MSTLPPPRPQNCVYILAIEIQTLRFMGPNLSFEGVVRTVCHKISKGFLYIYICIFIDKFGSNVYGCVFNPMPNSRSVAFCFISLLRGPRYNFPNHLRWVCLYINILAITLLQLSIVNKLSCSLFSKFM